MNRLKIGITIGDINGIGPEVLIKALSNDYMLKLGTPIIYASSKVVGYHKNIVNNPAFSFQSISSADKASPGKINVVNCWQENVHISLGKATEEGGRCAYIALDKAVDDWIHNRIDVLVTAPINKHAMKMAGFPYLGHTDYISDKLESKGHSLMMMVSDELITGLVTTHIPLSGVADQIVKDRVVQKINTLHQSLAEDFGYDKPVIAVLGLNPHAGDESEIGEEEDLHIRPAIIESKKKGMLVSGPFPADGFFGSGQYTKVDAILAMYHDQGLIPFKTLSFEDGINYTAGLSRVRTSPDHGTAYDLAGKNVANESSFRKAIYKAVDIYKSRKNYHSIRQNSIQKTEKPAEAVKAD